MHDGVVVIGSASPGDVFAHLNAVIHHAGEEWRRGQRIVALRDGPFDPRDKGEIEVELFLPKSDNLLEIAALNKGTAGRAQTFARIGVVSVVERQLQQLHYIDIDRRNACAVFAGNAHFAAAHTGPIAGVAQRDPRTHHHIDRDIVVEERRHPAAVTHQRAQSCFIEFQRCGAAHADDHGWNIHIGIAERLQEDVRQLVDRCLPILGLAAQRDGLEKLVAAEVFGGAPVAQLVGLKAFEQEALAELLCKGCVNPAGLAVAVIIFLQIAVHAAHGNAVAVRFHLDHQVDEQDKLQRLVEGIRRLARHLCTDAGDLRQFRTAFRRRRGFRLFKGQLC